MGGNLLLVTSNELVEAHRVWCMLPPGPLVARESHPRRGEMTTEGGCNCGMELSRRGLLKAGLSAAAVAAIGGSSEALAESQAQSKAETKQVLRAAGVRSI